MNTYWNGKEWVEMDLNHFYENSKELDALKMYAGSKFWSAEIMRIERKSYLKELDEAQTFDEVQRLTDIAESLQPDPIAFGRNYNQRDILEKLKYI
jgi:hypothetical protein